MIYDLIVIGAGAGGIMASIVAAQNNNSVLVLEKLPSIASKLKATGGGKCNITNTLSNEEFMSHFGRDGRFMQDALKALDHNALIKFLNGIGVETHAPDGLRVFPTSHNSQTIISALQKKMIELNIETICSQKVEELLYDKKEITGLKTQDTIYRCKNIILASGGLGFPTLGANGDGYSLSEDVGHTVTQAYPAMLPLHTKEKWVENCRADTIAKVKLKIDIKKYKKLQATGDLIFTKKGIRGPVVLDFAREITPLLSKYKEVPIVLKLTNDMNEDEIFKQLKKQKGNILDAVSTLLPKALSNELCKLANIDTNLSFSKIDGKNKAKLLTLLASTPLTIIGSDGFKMAMITRGGINLKEINPKTMQSKIINGLYFCGEVINIDGPCGGYNLQWSFSSGCLAGQLT
ncbi:MAG: NAD(P)/FAD-dependent oxidoreductase [Campylobacterota bacterium]|nr:NAD(P)/FAD-dependent oxidoreductase [Campylobacterota bacterium]